MAGITTVAKEKKSARLELHTITYFKSGERKKKNAVGSREMAGKEQCTGKNQIRIEVKKYQNGWLLLQVLVSQQIKDTTTRDKTEGFSSM